MVCKERLTVKEYFDTLLTKSKGKIEIKLSAFADDTTFFS